MILNPVLSLNNRAWNWFGYVRWYLVNSVEINCFGMHINEDKRIFNLQISLIIVARACIFISCYTRSTFQCSVSRHGNSVEWEKQFVKFSSFLEGRMQSYSSAAVWWQRKVDLRGFHLSFLPNVGTVVKIASFSSRAVPADVINLSCAYLYPARRRSSYIVLLYVLGRVHVWRSLLHVRATFQCLLHLCSWQEHPDLRGVLCKTSRKLEFYAIIHSLYTDRVG